MVYKRSKTARKGLEIVGYIHFASWELDFGSFTVASERTLTLGILDGIFSVQKHRRDQ